MRLVIILSHFNPAAGGAEGFASAVAHGLAERGHEVQIVAQRGQQATGSLPVHIVPLSQVSAQVQALAPEVTVDWGLIAPADIHRLGGGLTAEFLRYNLIPHRPFMRFCKKLQYRFSGKLRREIRRETELLQNPAAQVLAVSEFVAAQVRRQIPAAAARLSVLHNGVDIHRFTPENRRDRRAAIRRELGLREDQTVFLFAAHNPRLKNFPLLKRVFNTLAPSLPQAILLVVGRHRPPAAAPWLNYAGSVADMAPLYAAADALLHPTCYDACANVVLEALAAGLPVLSSDLNGSAEVIVHGESGFVLPVTGFDPDRIHQLWSDAIRRLVSDQAERQRVGAAARQLAEQHSMESYLEALAELLERRRRDKAGS